MGCARVLDSHSQAPVERGDTCNTLSRVHTLGPGREGHIRGRLLFIDYMEQRRAAHEDYVHNYIHAGTEVDNNTRYYIAAQGASRGCRACYA